ncbi:MAG: glutamine amidotransferase [Pelotomaculum sp.]|uniref:Lipid II isoglutaminyl synthase (glutamine-hydrolyzing) subunit GatD n=1 Tax=Pelotomaculum thermopropionicum (strain DSM 13744 / JCM 10971 / SI) TaxID=370438 RepID=A5D1R1_PELTS|nr:glutamine amidotransferase [Pelotomaculum sp.]BAF59829.1 predicted glutamine amidotransferase [Pelotomaculum thermopropionicum SI]
MISVCHLYPDLLDLYGDRGNVVAFKMRCQWRNIPVTVRQVSLGDKIDFKEYDFVFLGGGSDREQNLIAADLMNRRDEFKEAVEDGLVVLAICGGYQLLGKYYLAPGGKEISGLGMLDLYTRAGDRRLVGNAAVEVELDGKRLKVIGFENHSGQTFLGEVSPFGKVLSGYGNNGLDGTEGARYKNVFCSYLHGPLLPKNAGLTDYLISLALRRRGCNRELTPLDDSFEDRARDVMLARLGLGRR